MDGVHDMGGMDGFGSVVVEEGEPVFHAPWEGRVLALMRAMGAVRAWNLDMARSAIERLPPSVYLTSSYYERWLLGLESNLVQHGIVGADELSAGRSLREGPPPAGRLSLEQADGIPGRGSFERPAGRPANFEVGDRVRARNLHTTGHTRLPRYVRGRAGTVDLVHGCHVFPDSSVNGDEDPQWLYTVRFEGRELWGPDADPRLSVSVDAFEPYLEAA
ncbi:MAG: nitrile hydratase subunit beta [Acidimicrobiaceae bacterium]|nr:nitrile hydratase subunit beta [Acidimicrobiaceae bacterium]MBO0747489.1 nitrile hydratase subunit beta [Acidimicrobiaceae bacterium]